MTRHALLGAFVAIAGLGTSYAQEDAEATVENDPVPAPVEDDSVVTTDQMPQYFFIFNCLIFPRSNLKI